MENMKSLTEHVGEVTIEKHAIFGVSAAMSLRGREFIVTASDHKTLDFVFAAFGNEHPLDRSQIKSSVIGPVPESSIVEFDASQD